MLDRIGSSAAQLHQKCGRTSIQVAPTTGKTRSRGGKADRLAITEERTLPADVPAGSRFKGYEDVLVQDLVLRPHVVRFRRERWLTPDGRTVTAPMPAGIGGHFGSELRRFVPFQHHQGRVTVPRLRGAAHQPLKGDRAAAVLVPEHAARSSGPNLNTAFC